MKECKMPEPEKTVETIDPEKLMTDLEPAGGLKNMIDMMTPPVDDEEEERKEEKPTDPPAKEEKKESPPSKLEEMKPEDLILEVKKHQTLYNDTDKKYKELETKFKELETKQGTITDEKLNTFLTEFRTNPTKAYDKYQKDLNLPDMALFKGLVNSPNDNVLKLKHYQETELKPLIEKTFKFDGGTFKFDADEAEDPTTASAMWRKYSRAKEQELDNELASAIALKSEQDKKAREGREEDIAWIKDNLFGGDQAKADEAIKELNSIPEKILKGEAPPTSHPFRLRTFILGVNHERLKQEAVDKAVADTEKKIIDAYSKQGLYLKGELPEDLKSIKKSQSFKAGQKQDYTGNPAEDAMIKTLNN